MSEKRNLERKREKMKIGNFENTYPADFIYFFI